MQFRLFGTWLDDASLVEPAHGWAAVSFGHVRLQSARLNDFPVIDAGVALTQRVQAGASVPYYKLSYADGTAGSSGLGDMYINSKIKLIDPATARSGFGLAVGPVVEILNQNDPVDGGRFYWGAPVSVEWRQPQYRAYGSTGWFSRGRIVSLLGRRSSRP